MPGQIKHYWQVKQQRSNKKEDNKIVYQNYLYHIKHRNEYLFIGNIEKLEAKRMYKVEKIIGKRESQKKKGQFQYLVKWQGWSIKDSTWEPSKHLNNVKDLIQQYQVITLSLTNQKKQKKSQSSVEEIDLPEKQIAKKRGKTKNIQKSESLVKSNDLERSSQTISGTEQQKKQKNSKVAKKAPENQKFSKKGQAKMSEGSQNSQTIVQSNQKKTQKEEGKVKILGMKKQGNHFWYYIVQKNGDESWVVREYVVNNYPVCLIEFYEQRIVFNST